MNYPGTCGCSYLIELISLRVLITAELTAQGFGAGQSHLAQDFSLTSKEFAPNPQKEFPLGTFWRNQLHESPHRSGTSSITTEEALQLFSPHTPAGCGKALSVLTDPGSLESCWGQGAPEWVTHQDSLRCGRQCLWESPSTPLSPKEVALHPMKDGSHSLPPDNYWTEKDSAHSSGNAPHARNFLWIPAHGLPRSPSPLTPQLSNESGDDARPSPGAVVGSNEVIKVPPT